MIDQLDEDLVSDDDTTTATTTRAYEAVYKRQDGTTTAKYFQGDRLLEAAQKASERVENDPFTTLISVTELGELN